VVWVGCCGRKWGGGGGGERLGKASVNSGWLRVAHGD